jgi:hypothetical protein
MPPERATVEDFLVIVASLSDFWGDRDVRHLQPRIVFWRGLPGD